MMTVHEVSVISGVSARALRYYDGIGLLSPAEVTEAGYRLYDVSSLERLQMILLFRELEFPLKDIRGILDSPDFDRDSALDRQIELLTLRKERLENLIALARGIRTIGAKKMNFDAFDRKRIDEYAEEAKRNWGATGAYREFEQKTAGNTPEKNRADAAGLMAIFAEFGAMRNQAPDTDAAQAQVKRLRDYITEHYYACTDAILASLGQMYAGGGEMTDNIDAAGGSGTAAFAAAAIEEFVKAIPRK